MRHATYALLFLLLLLFMSCDGRTGYYDSEQQEIINTLTAREWKLIYQHVPNFEPESFDKGGSIYKFDSDGKGSTKFLTDTGELDEEFPVSYFQWTFTTDNFSVIYLGGKLEKFWLIDKLTRDELWVYTAGQDPVLHPNTLKTYCKFKAL